MEEREFITSEGYVPKEVGDNPRWIDTLDMLEFVYSLNDTEFIYRDCRDNLYKLTKEEHDEYQRGRFGINSRRKH